MFGKLLASFILGSVAALSGYGVYVAAESLMTDFKSDVAFLAALAGCVFIASSSTLIEMWLPRKEWIVRRRSFLWFFSGAFFLHDDEKNNETMGARTCTIFFFRTVALVMLVIFGGLYGITIVHITIQIFGFVISPHPIHPDWNFILMIIGMFAATLAVGLPFMAWLSYLEKKFKHNKRLLAVLIAVNIYIFLTLFLSVYFYVLPVDDLKASSLGWQILAVGGAIAFIAGIAGFGFALFYGISRAIQMLGTRFPVLHRIWEQSCPQRAFRIVQ